MGALQAIPSAALAQELAARTTCCVCGRARSSHWYARGPQRIACETCEIGPTRPALVAVPSPPPARSVDLTPLTPAQAALVETHAAWARAGAQKRYPQYAPSGVTVEDLQSAAYLGLIMAARRFDPARGFVFKTFAMPACESMMRREVQTRRRLDGAVYDATAEGGMRQVQTRIAWPVDEQGRQIELGAVPASQADATDRVLRRQAALAACPAARRALLARVLAGETTQEIATALRRSPRYVTKVIADLIPVLRARLSRGGVA